MNCSICDQTGIPASALLCPSCGSLMERDEIIHAEDSRRAAAKEVSIMKGKIVELRTKRDRYKKQLENRKIFMYMLSAALVWAVFFKGSKKPVEHPATQELRDSITNYSHEIRELKAAIRNWEPLSQAAPPPPEAEKITYHTVKKGDCLAKIADVYFGDYKRYDELASLNGLSYPFTLKKGQQVKISITE